VSRLTSGDTIISSNGNGRLVMAYEESPKVKINKAVDEAKEAVHEAVDDARVEVHRAKTDAEIAAHKAETERKIRKEEELRREIRND
jgi:hypothetical protein